MNPSRFAFWLFAFCLVCRSPDARAESARSIVKRELLSRGFSTGYDVANHRHVAIGVAESDVQNGIDPVHLLPIRNHLHTLALFRAKQDLLEEISALMSGQDRVSDRFEADGSAEMLGQSVLTVMAGGLYCGFLPLVSAESLEQGRYQVAIAVGWSEKSERDARAALSGKGPMPKTDEIPSPAWMEWASGRDFTFLCGAWPFSDSEGIRRFVGVGVADVEGKTDVALVQAMRLARVKASQALAYALCGDIEARKTAEQMVARSETPNGSGGGISVESFENRIAQSVRGKRFRDFEVYQTTVIHPLIGRKLAVSVVGIEPRDLAEMRLLEDGGVGDDDAPTVRPEYDSPPPSRRPDHSFRPATARPEHPWRRP